MIYGVLFAVGLALTLPFGAWAQSIKVDGSSTVYPISKSAAEEFQKARKGAASIIVGMSGTGGGFKKFCRGETDVAGTSRPILGGEIETCKGRSSSTSVPNRSTSQAFASLSSST